MIRKIPLILSLALISSPVLAQGSFSGEILLGSADQETSGSGGSISGSSTSFALRGVYGVNENLGVEFGYHNYGSFSETYIDSFGDTINDEASATAIAFGVKGIAPVHNIFSLVGRVGLALWDYELEETDSAFPGTVFSFSDDGSDIYFGFGGEFSVQENIHIGIEYSMLEMNMSFFGSSVKHKVNNLGVSVGMSF